jgi:hypothetical protein
MDPSREIIDEIYRERVRRARSTPSEEKLLDGARLFDFYGIPRSTKDADFVVELGEVPIASLVSRFGP